MGQNAAKIETITEELKRLEDLEEKLRKRRAELSSMDRTYGLLAKDKGQLRDDVTEGEINYTLGQSAGFVSGLEAAVSCMTISLASVYDEDSRAAIMYAFKELGETIGRARLKLEKDRNLVEKSGWKEEWKRQIVNWVKQETDAPEKVE